MRRDGWLLSPENEGDLYWFLRTITQEWQFFRYAEALGFPEVTPSTLKGATLARDQAVEQWNDWMFQRQGREWFQVFQQHTLEEDYRQEGRGIFVTAGPSVLVVHRCESALAIISRHERWVFAPDGKPLTPWEEEQVTLHCILAPPHDDTLKVLPVSVVPNVSVFNH